MREPGQGATVAFSCALAFPADDGVDLSRGQPAFADERPRARIRLPWRHRAALNRLDDLRRPRPNLFVRDQTEWGGTVRTMAVRALRVEDGSDVARERCRSGGRLRSGHVSTRAPCYERYTTRQKYGGPSNVLGPPSGMSGNHETDRIRNPPGCRTSACGPAGRFAASASWRRRCCSARARPRR